MRKFQITISLLAILLVKLSVVKAQTQPDSLTLAKQAQEERMNKEAKAFGEGLFSSRQPTVDTLSNDSLQVAQVNSLYKRIVKMERIQDDTEKQGTIVLNICIDQDGKVTSTEYSAKGSTTRDEYLLKLAIENVQKWEFSKGEAEEECGTMTFNFRLQ